MAKHRVVPNFISDVWKLLQTHYNNYMDSGGSHAEYVNVNGLSEEDGESLLKAYKRTVKNRKKS